MAKSKFISVFALSGLCLIAAGCRGHRTIPDEKLAAIYAEMYLLDQSAVEFPDISRKQRDSLMYDPIIAKYGYSFEDYDRTVREKLDDPAKMAKVFEQANVILTKKKLQVERRINDAKDIETGHSFLDSLRTLARDSVTSSVPLRVLDVLTFREDTVRLANYVVFDSAAPVHISSAMELYESNPFKIDSNFRSPLMPLTRAEYDSLYAVRDSLSVADSVVSDVPPVADDKVKNKMEKIGKMREMKKYIE